MEDDELEAIREAYRDDPDHVVHRLIDYIELLWAIDAVMTERRVKEAQAREGQ